MPLKEESATVSKREKYALPLRATLGNTEVGQEADGWVETQSRVFIAFSVWKKQWSWLSSWVGLGLCCSLLLSRVRLFVTPRAVACQAPLFMGILQARVLEWVAMTFSRDSFQPTDWTQVSDIVGRLPSEPPGSPGLALDSLNNSDALWTIEEVSLPLVLHLRMTGGGIKARSVS